MSNPAELLIRGNPAKRRRGRKPTTKGTTMATRRRRRKSPASIAKRRAKRAARKQSRKGKMPSGLAAWHAKRAAGKVARKARRSRRRGKASHKRRAKRRSRARSRRRTHALAFHVTSRKRRKSRGSKRGGRGRSKRRAARRIRSNAGAALTLFSPFTSPVESIKDVVKGGLGGIGAAVAGAGAAVVGGAFVSRLTNGLLFRFAPQLASNPLAARGIGALNFLLPGWAVAKWAPGISGRVRRGILTGAAVAAIVEAIKPGVVRDTFARIPIIGGVFGPSLSGMADAMGDYLAFGMSGHNDNGAAASLMYDDDADDMADYVASVQDDMDRTMRTDGGMGDYAMFGTER